MDEHNETLTAPPDNLEASPAMMDAIMKAIGELDIATHADFVGMNERLDEQRARIEAVETALTELPAKFASVESLDKIKSSQVEYELSRRQLTEQLAGLTLIQADNQEKFTAIKDDVSTMKTAMNTFTDNITVFMQTQREMLDNHDARINNADRAIVALKDDQVQDVKELRSVREQVSGLDSDVNGLRGDVGATVRPMQDTVKEVKAKQDAHDTRLLTAEKTLIKLDTSFGSVLWFFNNPDGRKVGGVLLGIFFFTQIAALVLLWRIASLGILAR